MNFKHGHAMYLDLGMVSVLANAQVPAIFKDADGRRGEIWGCSEKTRRQWLLRSTAIITAINNCIMLLRPSVHVLALRPCRYSSAVTLAH